MAKSFQPVWEAVLNMVKAFNEMDDSTKDSTGTILGLAKILVEAGTLMTGVILTIGQSAEVLERIFKTVGGAIGVLWNSFQIAFDLIAGAVIGAVILVNDQLAAMTWGETSKNFQAEADASRDLLNAIGQDLVKQTDDYTKSAGMMWEGLAGGADKATDKMGDVKETIDEIPDTKLIDWSLALDVPSIDKTKKVIDEVSGEQVATISPEIDTGALAKAKKILDEDLLKKLEIEADVDIARIKSQAEIAQTALEFKAKIDIADIEGGVKKIEALAASLSAGFTSTGETITSLFGLLTGEGIGFSEKWAIEDQISVETKLREAQFELQKKLTEAEIKLMQDKARRLAQGDPLITVDGTGLAPHLEMIMWEILGAIQVRASAEYNEFLLGLPA